jgi:hemerythrin
MAVFEWNDDYGVNVFTMDKHHKKLFSIINNLYDLMATSAADDKIIKIINELLEYTKYHFSEEEQMMTQIKYPDLIAHQKLHREFTAKLEEYQKAAQNGMAIFVAIKVADTGMNWLKAHILKADAGYKNYMLERGIAI